MSQSNFEIIDGPKRYNGVFLSLEEADIATWDPRGLVTLDVWVDDDLVYSLEGLPFSGLLVSIRPDGPPLYPRLQAEKMPLDGDGQRA